MRVDIYETKRGSVRLDIGYRISIYLDSPEDLIDLSSKINLKISEFIRKKYGK